MGRSKRRKQQQKAAEQGEENNESANTPKQSDNSTVNVKGNRKSGSGAVNSEVIDLSDSTEDGKASKTEVNAKPSTSRTAQGGSGMNLRIYTQGKTQIVEKITDKKEKITDKKWYSQIKDPRLIPRIREYLETLPNKNCVSIPRMAEYLQKKYHEYARKQKNVFCKYVDRAYFHMDKGNRPATSVITDSDPENEGAFDSDSDDVEVMEPLVEYKDTNAMNNMMSSIYKNSPTHVSSSDERKRKAETQRTGGSKRSKSDTEAKEVTEKVMYASPDVLQRNFASTGLTGPRRSAADRYFIDRKGNKEGKETEETPSTVSREANIQRFLGGLPSRTSYSAYVNAKNDPRQTSSGTLYKIYRDPQTPVSKPEQDGFMVHGGISADNVGVSARAPRSPTPPHPEGQGGTSSGEISDGERERRDTERRGKLKSPRKHKKNSGKSKKEEKSDQAQPKKERGPSVQTSSITFADIGGNESTLIEICKLLVHMRHPEVHEQLGITPPRGFLLHGPPGCGKTLLANAIAGELELPLIKVASTELVSGVSGDSEEKIRELFDKAVSCAPCVLFIDEIDSITPKRETASKDMERRIVAQLLACMDDLSSKSSAHVLVIGATNRPDSLDPALRRAGRFDREICLGIPDERSRLGILRVLCKTLPLTPGFDQKYLAKATPGYVGADLIALTREAAMVAVNRVFQDLQSETKTAPPESTQYPSSSNIVIIPTDCANNNSESGDKPTECAASGVNSQANFLEYIMDTDQTHVEVMSDQITNPVGNSACRTIQTVVGEETESINGALPWINSDMDTAIVEVNTGSANSALQIIDCDTDIASVEVETGAAGVEVETGAAGDATVNGTSDSPLYIIHTIVPDIEENVIGDAGQSQNSGSDQQQTSGNIDVDNTHNVQTGDGNSDVNVAMDVDQSDSGKTPSTSRAHTGNTPTEELSSVLSWLKEHPPLTEDQLKDLYISMEDFKEALRYVQPSAKREGFATIPDVTWDDIGALYDVREALQLAILAPVRHAEAFQSLGLSRAQGVLLAGPPGCGKTLLAKAVANESGINFISVKGPELLNMYVGESERAVRTVFQRARNSAPCVIFFDELDALCPRRSGSSEAGSSARVVNQLLTEMDGLEERKQVFIMAATNRPDIIDPAVLRPGRLDKTLYVGLPAVSDRLDILRCITKNGTRPCLAGDVDLAKIAEDQRCEGYTGADLRALLTEASLAALNEVMRQKRTNTSSIQVNMDHFNTAFRKIKPSVSAKDLQKYTTMGVKLSTE